MFNPVEVLMNILVSHLLTNVEINGVRSKRITVSGSTGQSIYINPGGLFEDMLFLYLSIQVVS